MLHHNKLPNSFFSAPRLVQTRSIPRKHQHHYQRERQHQDQNQPYTTSLLPLFFILVASSDRRTSDPGFLLASGCSFPFSSHDLTIISCLPRLAIAVDRTNDLIKKSLHEQLHSRRPPAAAGIVNHNHPSLPPLRVRLRTFTNTTTTTITVYTHNHDDSGCTTRRLDSNSDPRMIDHREIGRTDQDNIFVPFRL